jgi:hypothetical protein
VEAFGIIKEGIKIKTQEFSPRREKTGNKRFRVATTY